MKKELQYFLKMEKDSFDWNLLMYTVSLIESVKIAGLGTAIFINSKNITIKTGSIDAILIQLSEYSSYFYNKLELGTGEYIQEIRQFKTEEDKRNNLYEALKIFAEWYINKY